MPNRFHNPGLYDGSHGYVAQYGANLLDWLNPLPGERILDLGCGTGDLASEMAARGAVVTGVDISPEMVAAARRKYPALSFEVAPADAIPLPETPYDAVFSNAVLHWIPDLAPVAHSLAAVLRPGGRFVAEFGGVRCCHTIYDALEAEIAAHGHPVKSPVHFRPLSRLAADFESAPFRIERAEWFRRDTRLQGPDGMLNFLRMFCTGYLDNVPAPEQADIFERTVARLRPLLCKEDGWHADYTRQRLLAVRLP